MWCRGMDANGKRARTRTVEKLVYLGPWPVRTVQMDAPPTEIAGPVVKCARCEKAVACGRFALTSLVWDFQLGEMVEDVTHKHLCGECGFTIGQDRKTVLLKDKDTGKEQMIHPLRYVKVERV